MCAALAGLVHADDTEIFLSRYDATGVSGGRAKVLIIVDNSGSMEETIRSVKPAFDAGANYLGSAYTSLDPGARLDRLRSDRLYWSEDGRPPEVGTSQYIDAGANHCASSVTPLATIGTFNDYVAAWQAGSWWVRRGWYYFATTSSLQQSPAWECQSDVNAGTSDNAGHSAGFPCDNGPACGTVGGVWDDDGLRDYPDTFRNLYSAQYMAWYHNQGMATERTKMEIAQEVLTGLIETNPNVDFGLMTFNTNGVWNSRRGAWDDGLNGGRVIDHLERMDAADRTAMVDTIENLSPLTNTPLCETLYEAYRYIASPDGTAQSVLYGNDDTDIRPRRDPCAENASGSCSADGTYESPLEDCEQMYIVLMTDGVPTLDQDANTRIKALTGVAGCGRYENKVYIANSGWQDSTAENCLPELAEHLFRHDLDDRWENGDNVVLTFTVGFQTDQTLLGETARRGGGKYFTAENAVELNEAFQKTINEILSSNTNFAAPAVAVDAFNRTRSLDDLFYSMFRPYNTPRWPGNIKKLTINDNGEVLDRTGTRAIDPDTGNIKATASTYWTSVTQDGMNVEAGGAGALLAARNPATRRLLTNTGDGDGLAVFNLGNAGVTREMLGADDATERGILIDWASGIDVDDEDEDGSKTDARPWIMGDLIHSRPLAINYGGRPDDQDVRIVFGTNAGFLHMIDASDGTEDWAFFAKETAPIIKTLYENSITSTHPYGIDSSVSDYILDANGNGVISRFDGDKAYIYFGMRRGGGSYYAMDVTAPDNPAMLWRKDNTHLPELGQSWSEPEITLISGHDDPVAIVGAGYDTHKDLQEIGSPDNVGRGLYILDAEDGDLMWSATPAAGGASNLSVPDLADSVPAAVTPVDGNGDGISDRIYFADTGGNVWRIDMIGAKTDWTVYKLASLGGDTATNDRRFFNRIDVVQTRYGNFAYDAVILGSGNRSHPLETDVVNRFYVLRDYHINSAIHLPNDGNAATSPCDAPGANPDGLPCAEMPTVITEADLYDVTANLIQDGTDAQKRTARDALLSKTTRGWYVTLQDAGEKSLSRSITLQGTVFFTTYVPPNPDDPANENICRPSEGTGFLYAVSVHDGSAKYDWAVPNGSLSKADRRKQIKSSIPDHAVAHFGDPWIRLVGVGAGTDGKGSEDTNLRLISDTLYWYEDTRGAPPSD